jgi:tetrahydromethanopterin S-methyltransferase subunit G
MTTRTIEERVSGLESAHEQIINQQGELSRSVDTLRTDMNSRFDDVNSRFNDMNSRFNDMSSQLGDMRGELSAMNDRFDSINGRFDSMNGRFDSMNGRLTTMMTVAIGSFVALSAALIGVIIALIVMMA